MPIEYMQSLRNTTKKILIATIIVFVITMLNTYMINVYAYNWVIKDTYVSKTKIITGDTDNKQVSYIKPLRNIVYQDKNDLIKIENINRTVTKEK